MTFEELKAKYSSFDLAKEHDNLLLLCDFTFWKNGEIGMTRNGQGYDGNRFSVSVCISLDRMPDEMDKFIDSLSLCAGESSL